MSCMHLAIYYFMPAHMRTAQDRTLDVAIHTGGGWTLDCIAIQTRCIVRLRELGKEFDRSIGYRFPRRKSSIAHPCPDIS